MVARPPLRSAPPHGHALTQAQPSPAPPHSRTGAAAVQRAHLGGQPGRRRAADGAPLRVTHVGERRRRCSAVINDGGPEHRVTALGEAHVAGRRAGTQGGTLPNQFASEATTRLAAKVCHMREDDS